MNVVPSPALSVKICVRCGKCLAVCPFYRLLRQEELSPRGRVVLSERSGMPDEVRCFGCLRCAAACPYELSPLDNPGQRLGEGEDERLRSLLALIYYREPLSPNEPGDPLMAMWHDARRGALPPLSAPRFGNGELFHPFLDPRAAVLLSDRSRTNGMGR